MRTGRTTQPILVPYTSLRRETQGGAFLGLIAKNFTRGLPFPQIFRGHFQW
jgi:hypothetical protein